MTDSAETMRDLKHSKVFSFDDGLLTIKISGYGQEDGWGTLAFHERQIEIDADGFHCVEIAPSELREIRDFLNRVTKPGPSDPIPSQPDEQEAIAREPTVEQMDRIAASKVRPYSHNSALILDGLRDETDIVQAAAHARLAMQAERRGEPTTNAAVAQWLEPTAHNGLVAGSSPASGTNTQPAPIAGLEPVAWRYWWRSKYLTYSLNEPRPDDAEPLYTRAQLEAHAAEQVRPLVEALEGLIEAVELDADEGLEGIGSYTGARLTDAKNAIRARGQV